jgi:hypothetical protein
MTGLAEGQTVSCTARERPLVGVAAGWSSPYVYLDSDAVEDGPGSIQVHGGVQIGGRGDFSIGGPVRVRVEGSTAWWSVDRQTYSPDAAATVTTGSEGHVNVRQLGASIGLRGGRAPLCWYVLAGGGLYSLSFRDDTLRRPGFQLTPGLEFPTGDRGRLQIEAQIHFIDTNGRPPFSSTKALAASIVFGWAYQF